MPGGVVDGSGVGCGYGWWFWPGETFPQRLRPRRSSEFYGGTEVPSLQNSDAFRVLCLRRFGPCRDNGSVRHDENTVTIGEVGIGGSEGGEVVGADDVGCGLLQGGEVEGAWKAQT